MSPVYRAAIRRHEHNFYSLTAMLVNRLVLNLHQLAHKEDMDRTASSTTLSAMRFDERIIGNLGESLRFDHRSVHWDGDWDF